MNTGAINLSQGFPDFDLPKEIMDALAKAAYEFDIRLVEEGFRQGAKEIVVCNSSNPCGKVFSEEELMEIGSLAVKYDAFVVTDEAYEHMVYAPNKHVCVASLPEGS